MASLRKKLSMGMGKSKKKKKTEQQQHSHGGDEQVFYEVEPNAHGVAGCPGCAALKRQVDELKAGADQALTRRNAEVEAELASLRKVIQRTLSRASGEHNDSHNDKMRPGGARHP